MTKTYNHAYSVAFAVSGSTSETGKDVTPAMLKAALLKRISDLDNTHEQSEWLEACDCPWDSYEEEPVPTKTYNVIVTRDTTESCTMLIEAASSEEAIGAALKRSCEDILVWKQDWTPNASKHCYITSCEELGS
jgi:hypothetical protein